MTASGLLKTRSNLSQIINNVLHGEEHVILRKNVPVAKIVPIMENLINQSKELIKRTKEIRHSIGKVTIHELNAWKKEGRK